MRTVLSALPAILIASASFGGDMLPDGDYAKNARQSQASSRSERSVDTPFGPDRPMIRTAGDK